MDKVSVANCSAALLIPLSSRTAQCSAMGNAMSCLCVKKLSVCEKIV